MTTAPPSILQQSPVLPASFPWHHRGQVSSWPNILHNSQLTTHQWQILLCHSIWSPVIRMSKYLVSPSPVPASSNIRALSKRNTKPFWCHATTYSQALSTWLSNQPPSVQIPPQSTPFSDPTPCQLLQPISKHPQYTPPLDPIHLNPSYDLTSITKTDPTPDPTCLPHCIKPPHYKPKYTSSPEPSCLTINKLIKPVHIPITTPHFINLLHDVYDALVWLWEWAVVF